MRRALIALFIVLIFHTQAFCAEFNVERRGEPHIQNGRIIQDIILKNVRGSEADFSTIKVAPLDAEMTNIQNPNIKIPISHLTILKDSMPYPLTYGKSTVVSAGAAYDAVMRIIIDNVGYLRAGTYTARLEFKSTGRNSEFTNVYVLSVDIGKNQEIILGNNAQARIKIDKEQVFKQNLLISNDTNTKIDVKSNVPWAVYLDTHNTNLTPSALGGECYFQIKSKTPNIASAEEKRILLEPNRRYQLASGDVTRDTMGNASPASFYIEYSYKNSNNGYIEPGTKNAALRYIVQEKN